MKVRMTIRIVKKLDDLLNKISKTTGKSKNSIIVDACWELVNEWKDLKRIWRKEIYYARITNF